MRPMALRWADRSGHWRTRVGHDGDGGRVERRRVDLVVVARARPAPRTARHRAGHGQLELGGVGGERHRQLDRRQHDRRRVEVVRRQGHQLPPGRAPPGSGRRRRPRPCGGRPTRPPARPPLRAPPGTSTTSPGFSWPTAWAMAPGRGPQPPALSSSSARRRAAYSATSPRSQTSRASASASARRPPLQAGLQGHDRRVGLELGEAQVQRGGGPRRRRSAGPGWPPC